MDKQIELKPCPFCGGEAELQSEPWSAVICANCRAMSHCFPHSGKYSSDEKAIEAWNRRVDDDKEK